MLAAVIKGPTIEGALQEMEWVEHLVDLIELRLDYFEARALADLGRIAAEAPKPLLFTLRKQEQGGNLSLSEGERLDRIEHLLSFHPAYCDLEADTNPLFIERIARKFPKCKLIGSYHNFEETPENLAEILENMKNPHFSIYKIAVKARSTIDLIRLMIFAQENSSKIPLSCISMGELGQPSRVLGPIVGNAIDYSTSEEESSQLFQYNLKTLHEKFHYSQLNRQTEIFALLGNPVAESPGDQFHNDVFRKEKRNAVYVKLRLDAEELPLFSRLSSRLPFKGFSVTIPLKEAILPLLDRIDPASVAIGAINTIVIDDHHAIGTNTDAPGALNAIERHIKVKNKRVAILGAGGTARAIAYEAKRRGAAVAIFNRTYSRAKKIASDLAAEAFPMEEIEESSYDLLVNTIPPVAYEKPPFDFGHIPRSAMVMDVVYRPKETPILKAAKKRGCHCIYGEEMFVEQARLQQIDWKKKYTTLEF